METIAVYANDAAYARHLLEPMLHGAPPTRWVVVACPPTLTRHAGRWLSQSARHQWRERWAVALFAELEPLLAGRASASAVERVVARRPLADVTRKLEQRLGALRLLDARRPRAGKPDEPICASQPPSGQDRWTLPLAATAGIGMMIALAD